MNFTKGKKSDSKSYIFCDCIYIIFWKRLIFWNRKKGLYFPGCLRREERQTIKRLHIGIFMVMQLFCMVLWWWRYYTMHFSKPIKLYGAKTEFYYMKIAISNLFKSLPGIFSFKLLASHCNLPFCFFAIIYITLLKNLICFSLLAHLPLVL